MTGTPLAAGRRGGIGCVEETVTAQPLESRLARLEGAYEQVADRLNGLEQRMSAGFAQVDARFAQVDVRFVQLEQKIDANLRTTITWMLGQTAVILGAFAAFALHR